MIITMMLRINDLSVFVNNLLEVFPSVSLEGWCPQKCTGMKCRHDPSPMPSEPLSPIAGNVGIRVNESFEGSAAKQHDDGRINDGYLLHQPRYASLALIGARIAVLRRTTLDDVGNETVGLSAKSTYGQDLVEQLAGSSDKGAPLLVLIVSRTLADAH